MYEDGDVTARLIMSEVSPGTIESSEHPQIRAFGYISWITINKTSLLYTQDTYKWSDLLGGQYECGVLDRRSEWKV